MRDQFEYAWGTHGFKTSGKRLSSVAPAMTFIVKLIVAWQYSSIRPVYRQMSQIHATRASRHSQTGSPTKVRFVSRETTRKRGSVTSSEDHSYFQPSSERSTGNVANSAPLDIVEPNSSGNAVTISSTSSGNSLPRFLLRVERMTPRWYLLSQMEGPIV